MKISGFTLSTAGALHAQGATMFGIDLHGVDIIESEGQPYVVDMSTMPGFKGVPDAPLHLAEYFYDAAKRAAHHRALEEPATRIEATSQAHVS